MNRIDINKNAPAVASRETFVHAPVEVVWDVLSGLERWPQWNASITDMDLQGRVTEGTEFMWEAEGVKIRSQLKEVSAPNRIAWSGIAMEIMGGVSGVHVCELDPDKHGTKVRTEESLEGVVVSLFPGRMQKMLDGVLAQALSDLKKESERQQGSSQA
jgi:uncharacterized protein YndB with AHSA1/START domain